MNELVLANRAADWRRLKMLVLDSVSSPITKRVNNLGLDELFEWFGSRLVRRTRGLADWARFRSTHASRQCGNRRSRVRATACSRLSWRPVSRASRANVSRLVRARGHDQKPQCEIVIGRKS